MSRPSIDGLPRASAYQRKRVCQAGLETKFEARQEDELRARRLLSKAAHSELIDRSAAADLSKRLAMSAEKRISAQTLASKQYMRRARLRFTPSMARFLRRERRLPQATFTAVSWRWHVAPHELLNVSPRSILQSFRSDLNRSSADRAGGALMASIDLEFEPRRAIFVLHLHGIALGSMIAALDGLRTRRKYQPVRRECPGLVPIYRPIVVKPIGFAICMRQLSYLLKSHWKSKWRGEVGADGRFRTARRSQRIPEPYHSLALLWLDRQSLPDITLLIGMEAGSFGFRRTSSRQRVITQ